jgi:hypothetical protein
MIVYKSTTSLKLKALLMLFGIIFITIHFMIIHFVTKNSFDFYQFIKSKSFFWVLFLNSLIVMMTILVFRMRKIVVILYPLVALSVVFYGISVFLKTLNYSLAFWTLFLILFSSIYFISLLEEYSKAYYSTKKRWFEGRPKFIPKLEGELLFSNKSFPIILSNLDLQGCFAYFSNESSEIKKLIKNLMQNKDLSIKLKLSNSEIVLPVQVLSIDKEGFGVGLAFLVQGIDVEKIIFEFIDRVRSYGYV